MKDAQRLGLVPDRYSTTPGGSDKPPRKADLASALSEMLRLSGITGFEREFRFFPPRRWRFDLAFVGIKLAIECDGGTWTRGRHSRGKGFEGDCQKLNQAVLLGWRVLRFTTGMVKKGEAVNVIEKILKDRGQSGQ